MGSDNASLTICALFTFFPWYTSRWYMKFVPLVAFTTTQKSIRCSSGFEELYCLTGLYLDLLAIPPSSNEQCHPNMKTRFVCSFSDSIAAQSWWHLSPTFDNPDSGCSANCICLNRYSFIGSDAQPVNPLIGIESAGELNSSTGGVSKSDNHPADDCWYSSSILCPTHETFHGSQKDAKYSLQIFFYQMIWCILIWVGSDVFYQF